MIYLRLFQSTWQAFNAGIIEMEKCVVYADDITVSGFLDSMQRQLAELGICSRYKIRSLLMDLDVSLILQSYIREYAVGVTHIL
jgi:hypothetical protein